MNRARAGLTGLALAGFAAITWSAVSAIQNEAPDPTAELSPEPARPSGSTPDASSAQAPRAAGGAAAKPSTLPPPVTTETPMAERVAIVGVLNKRNGLARDLTLRPGQALRWGDLIVRLRACESTADWEPERLTGAFVQADKREPDGQWKRIFSGWLYKESPSLNVVEDPLYDVWPKSCTMRHPDIGPDTVSAGSPARRSIAKKSAATPAPADLPEPSPSASSNSTT